MFLITIHALVLIDSLHFFLSIRCTTVSSSWKLHFIWICTSWVIERMLECIYWIGNILYFISWCVCCLSWDIKDWSGRRIDSQSHRGCLSWWRSYLWMHLLHLFLSCRWKSLSWWWSWLSLMWINWNSLNIP